MDGDDEEKFSFKFDGSFIDNVWLKESEAFDTWDWKWTRRVDGCETADDVIMKIKTALTTFNRIEYFLCRYELKCNHQFLLP